MHLLDEVRRFLKERNLSDCRITAAVSGGADSICLLHALFSLKDELSLDLQAIHIQHNLRGAESKRDEQFCRDFCEMHGIPLKVVSCNVSEYAETKHISIETAARECRYAAFAEHCEGIVATAHTASDNLETILFRMARGTGLKGLCGIPPVRGQFIRPLLHAPRTQVEEYLQSHGLTYVTDCTNAQDCYRRNFLRHHVVPKLKECNPSLEETCAEMAETLRIEEDFLTAQAQAAFTACRQPDGSLKHLETLHPALQRRCIGMLLKEYGLFNRQNTVAVQSLLQNGGSLELVRGGLRAHAGRGLLWLESPASEILEKPLKIGKNCIFDGISVEASVIARMDSEKFATVHAKFTNFVLDYDIIKKCAMLHGRRPGLRLKTKGRAHSISIKKWLNAEVPPTERAKVHFLSDENGLLWVQGLGAAEHAAVTERTQNLLYLRIITE